MDLTKLKLAGKALARAQRKVDRLARQIQARVRVRLRRNGDCSQTPVRPFQVDRQPAVRAQTVRRAAPPALRQRREKPDSVFPALHKHFRNARARAIMFG